MLVSLAFSFWVKESGPFFPRCQSSWVARKHSVFAAGVVAYALSDYSPLMPLAMYAALAAMEIIMANRRRCYFRVPVQTSASPLG